MPAAADPGVAARERGQRFCELVPLDADRHTLLDALDCFIEQKGLREENVFFWVCDFVIRQTDAKKDLESLGDCVSAVGHTRCC